MDLQKENILIVDDDIDILELLQRHLKTMNYHTFKAVSVKEAVLILKDTFIDLLITDIQMPEVDGFQLLKFTNEHYPEMPKLVITGYPSGDRSMNFINSGAIDYLTKPFTKEELRKSIEKAFEHGKNRSVGQLKISQKSSYADMVGQSEGFHEVTKIIDRVKDNKATVLIKGETGTGKELVARAIHYSGKFSRAPFIAVNCAAIPEDLQEAELFGYVKGAFTGANDNRNGFFQAAQGGTLFLDEIGTASVSAQMKLLRALQEKEITKVGSQKTEKVDIRIIAATNADLHENIKSGKFRSDLYYRLSVVEIMVPPLRERKSDISLLTEKFIKKYGLEYRDKFLKITPEALRILERYNWPGNIRELENLIQRAVIMADGKIEISNLPDFLKYEIEFPEQSLKPLRDIEKDYIKKVLTYTKGNKTKAAKILQIDRKTLRDKLD